MSNTNHSGPHRYLSPVDGSITWEGKWIDIHCIEEVLQRGRAAGEAWRKRTREERIAVARNFAKLLGFAEADVARTISLETGKPYWESKTEVQAAVSKVSNAIDAIQQRRNEWTDGLSSIASVLRYRPLGVVAVIGPFNLPLHLPGAHIVPALLAGNAVLLKPSDKSPAVGDWIQKLWIEAGLPQDLLQTVHGGAEVVRAIVQSKQLDGLFFTGSYQVGCELHRMLGGRPECLVALEMGGNNPLVIESFSNREAAILAMLQSSYITSGQRCTCARRLIVVDTPQNRELVRSFTTAITKIRVGLPFEDPGPFMGPLIHQGAAEGVLLGQNRLRDAGASPLVECHRVTSKSSGECSSLLTPGLWDATGLELPDEEVFGPLATLQFVPSFDEALRLANRSKYGLSAGLLSTSQEHFEHFAKEVRAGIINWNSPTTGATGKLPFGGIGASGNHRPSGYFASDYCDDPIASVQVATMQIPSNLPIGLEKVLEG